MKSITSSRIFVLNCSLNYTVVYNTAIEFTFSRPICQLLILELVSGQLSSCSQSAHRWSIYDLPMASNSSNRYENKELSSDTQGKTHYLRTVILLLYSGAYYTVQKVDIPYSPEG